MTTANVPMPVVRLERWFRYRDILVGRTYGHPRFQDGTLVMTSRIRHFNPKARFAVTRNTRYNLGEPDDARRPQS